MKAAASGLLFSYLYHSSLLVLSFIPLVNSGTDMNEMVRDEE